MVALCTCTADVITMVRPATGTERHFLGVPRVFRLRALPPDIRRRGTTGAQTAAACGAPAPMLSDTFRLPQCPECCAEFFAEDLWLFPCGEVTAFVGFVVVGEVGIGL